MLQLQRVLQIPELWLPKQLLRWWRRSLGERRQLLPLLLALFLAPLLALLRTRRRSSSQQLELGQHAGDALQHRRRSLVSLKHADFLSFPTVGPLSLQGTIGTSGEDRGPLGTTETTVDHR